MGKRIDFSLGMKDVSSGDMPDLYDRRSQSRVTETIREANREDAERRIIEEEEIDEYGGGSEWLVRSRGHSFIIAIAHGAASCSINYAVDGPQDSTNSQETHRNRFFPRFGRNAGQSFDLPPVDVEQGRLDPRSGLVSDEAQRVDSSNTEPFPAAPTRSQTDFEMRRFTERH